MPNLRSMLDETTIFAQAPQAIRPSPVAQQQATQVNKPKTNGKGSPMANHIKQHVDDPLGSTTEGFKNLTQKKLEYDQAREEMQRGLAPVQSVINHVSQMHNLTPDNPMMAPGMDPNAMNPDNPDNLDEEGNPLPPSGQPGQQMSPNMSQTVGKMNQSRPSMVGNQPGVAPGPGQSVVPPKLGMPSPGAPGAMQQGKPAAKPKGAGKLPGAKGPGDKKVAGKTKKAQDNSSRQIKVHVSAQANTAMVRPSGNLESSVAFSNLKAGPASLSDKSTDSGNELAYNPVMRAGKKCPRCGGSHSLDACTMKSAGHSKGARKGWSVRNKGHVSDKEKQAHYETMEGGGPGSGRRPGGGSKVGYDPTRPRNKEMEKRDTQQVDRGKSGIPYTKQGYPTKAFVYPR